MYLKESQLIPFHIIDIVEQAFQPRAPLCSSCTPIYGYLSGFWHEDGISILKNHNLKLLRFKKCETRVFVIHLAMIQQQSRLIALYRVEPIQILSFLHQEPMLYRYHHQMSAHESAYFQVHDR